MADLLSPNIDNFAFLWAGIETTLIVSALSVVVSLAIGFTLGLLRCFGPTWLRPYIAIYIDSMRAIPVLVVIVWTFFAFAILFGITMMPIVAAVGAISVHVAASVAEIVRAGIESIRQGQSWAGLALGMTQAQLLRQIILPQAIVRMLPSFGSVVIITIKDSAIASVIAVPGGMLLAAMRLSRFRLLRWPATGFVEFFRCTPLVIQVYWAFYVLPAEFDLQLSGFATGLLALTLNVSAFNSETFRAGIASIRRGQGDAGLAIGMSRFQVFGIVILPQAIKRVLPVLATTWVALFKDTSLVSVIAVSDLAYTAMQIRSKNFRILEMLTTMAVIYWNMGYPQAKLTDWIHRRMAGRE